MFASSVRSDTSESARQHAADTAPAPPLALDFSLEHMLSDANTTAAPDAEQATHDQQAAEGPDYEPGQDHAPAQASAPPPAAGDSGASPIIQARLVINTPGDIYEQEAERLAYLVTQTPNLLASQQDAAQAGGQAGPPSIQASAITGTAGITDVAPEVEARIAALRGGGQALPTDEQTFFRERFQYDFSQVRIHTDPAAAQLAPLLAAEAFTVGPDIVFADGTYAPGTPGGRELLAHELTHVMQQQGPQADTGAVGRSTPAALVQRSEETPPPVGAPTPPATATPATPPTLLSVNFTNSHPLTTHALSTDTRINPLWTPGAANHGAAYTINSQVALEVQLDVPAAPATAAPSSTATPPSSTATPPSSTATPPSSTATPTPTADPAAQPTSEPTAEAPMLRVETDTGTVLAEQSYATTTGAVTVPLTLSALPNSTAVGMTDQPLVWKARLNSAWVDIGSSGPHLLYWLMGAPLESPAPNFAVAKAVGYATGLSDAASVAAALRHGPRGVDGLAYDPSDPINTDPLSVYSDGVGICTDYANVLAYLARAIGLNANAVIYWGGFESLGKNIWATPGTSYLTLLGVTSTNPAYNPPGGGGWDFTYHAIARIAGALHDAALDIEGVSGQAFHDGKTVEGIESDGSVLVLGAVNTSVSQRIPRLIHQIDISTRDYTPFLTLADFGDVYALGMPSGAPQPYPMFSLWTATGLPPGIVLDTNGTLSGTPTSAGTFAVDVDADAGNGLINTFVLSVTINP